MLWLDPDMGRRSTWKLQWNSNQMESSWKFALAVLLPGLRYSKLAAKPFLESTHKQSRVLATTARTNSGRGAMSTSRALRVASNDNCTSVGLSTTPTQTVLLRDPAKADGALIVDPSCHVTEIGVPATKEKTLSLPERGIEQVLSVPVVANLDLRGNRLKSFDFSNETHVQNLTLAENDIDTLWDSSLPPFLRILDISGNSIQSVSGIYLPDTMELLNMSRCSLTAIQGLRLPVNLAALDLTGNSLREVEIRQSDVEVLTRLETALPVIQNLQCSTPNATIIEIRDSSVVCVIPDETFEALYGSTQVATVPAPKTAGLSTKQSNDHRTMLIIVLVAGSCVLAIVLFIGYRAFRGKYDFTTSFRSRRRGQVRQKNEPKSSGGVYVSSDTGERPFGFPMEYFEDDDVRFDAELAKYRIPKDEITKKKVIARGGFGVVYLARYRGMQVAVKQLQRDRMRYRTLEHFMTEIRLLASLNHPHVVGFLGVSWSTLHNLAVVLEFLPRGDLYSFLRKERKAAIRPKMGTTTKFGWFTPSSGKTELPTKAALASDIADALAYLHSMQAPIIHRDLKSKNVLLAHDFRAKLTDFGISRTQNLEETMTREVGTVAWIAPEVLKGARYTEKADIYSYGVLLTELDTCHSPYTLGFEETPKRTNTWIASKVSSGELQPVLLESCPTPVRELTLRCLSFDAEARPSAMEIVVCLEEMVLRASNSRPLMLS